MVDCTHQWRMTDTRSGYLVVEGCTVCGARSSFFSMEAVPPIDDYEEGEHLWTYFGSSQAVKFNLECESCGLRVDLAEMMGLMLSTCNRPQCSIAQLASREGQGTWIYVALCCDNTHASGRCVSEEGIQALSDYFNRQLLSPRKKIIVVPCKSCCSIDLCKGVVIADVGLTEIY